MKIWSAKFFFEEVIKVLLSLFIFEDAWFLCKENK